MDYHVYIIFFIHHIPFFESILSQYNPISQHIKIPGD